MPADPATEAYVQAVAGVLRDELGVALVGVYLHGSAAMTGFVRGRSDVDVLAVSSRALERSERARVGAALAGLRLPCPGSDLEFSLLTLDAAASPREETPFELHVSTHNRPRVVDGAGRAGDLDLAAHITVVRARGIAIVGPAPEAVFAPIPRAWYLAALLSDVDWAARHAAPEYRVLNACRIWRYLEEGFVGSKLEGAAWARGRVEDPSLIDAAVARQEARGEPAMDRVEVDRFVARVREQLATPA